MSRRFVLQVVILSVAFALATAVVGWVAVPLLALLWGGMAREAERPGAAACLAAGLGWVVLLVWTASQGPVDAVARRSASVMGIPSFGLYALTIFFPVAVAWAAATLGQVVRGIVASASRT